MAEAKKTYTIGLSKIEVGAIAEDGGMGGNFGGIGLYLPRHLHDDAGRPGNDRPLRRRSGRPRSKH